MLTQNYKGEKMEISSNINESFDDVVLSAMSEISQSRSKFQIEKFVIDQHTTDEMRYVQCVIELQNLYFTIKQVVIDMQIKELEIKDLRETKNKIDELKAQKMELELQQTKIVAVGAYRELNCLLDIFYSFPKQFTREEIDAAQPAYWNERLLRQASLEHYGNDGKVNWASLDSLRQIGLLSDENLFAVENIKEESK